MDDELNNEYGPIEESISMGDDSPEVEYESSLEAPAQEGLVEEQKNTIPVEVVHEFTSEELVELAQKITEIDAEIDNLLLEQLEHNEILKRIKKRIVGKDDTRRELSKQYVQGFTTNIITCTEARDYENRVINFVDEEGNIVKSEPIPENTLL